MHNKPEKEEGLLLTIPAAAARLGMCRKTLMKEIAAERLRYVMVGRQRRIDVLDIEAYRQHLRDTTPWQKQSASSSPRRGHRRGRRPAAENVLLMDSVAASPLAQSFLKKLRSG